MPLARVDTRRVRQLVTVKESVDCQTFKKLILHIQSTLLINKWSKGYFDY